MLRLQLTTYIELKLVIVQDSQNAPIGSGSISKYHKFSTSTTIFTKRFINLSQKFMKTTLPGPTEKAKATLLITDCSSRFFNGPTFTNLYFDILEIG